MGCKLSSIKFKVMHLKSVTKTSTASLYLRTGYSLDLLLHHRISTFTLYRSALEQDTIWLMYGKEGMITFFTFSCRARKLHCYFLLNTIKYSSFFSFFQAFGKQSSLRTCQSTSMQVLYPQLCPTNTPPAHADGTRTVLLFLISIDDSLYVCYAFCLLFSTSFHSNQNDV